MALYPITKGHTVVVWKSDVKDIHDLSDSEYDYFMQIVDVTRDALLNVLGVEKVYLLYMDEVRHVHWHLVPRYNEEGRNVFTHAPSMTSDFSLVPALKESFTSRLSNRDIREPHNR